MLLLAAGDRVVRSAVGCRVVALPAVVEERCSRWSANSRCRAAGLVGGRETNGRPDFEMGNGKSERCDV